MSSLFTGGTDASCTNSNPLVDLETLPKSGALPRFTGKLLNCNEEPTKYVSFGGQISKDLPITSVGGIFQLFAPTQVETNVYKVNDSVYDYTTSEYTPGDPNKTIVNTLIGYLMGKRVNSEEQYKLSGMAKDGAFTSNNYSLSHASLNTSGPYDKLQYFQKKSCVKGGEIKNFRDADADCIMAGVIHAYECFFEKRNCDKPKYHDYPVAYVVPADGVLGSKSDGDVLAAETSNVPTWFTPVQQEKSRVMLVSEFFCTNPNFELDDTHRDVIDRMCDYLYGGSFKQGKIDIIHGYIGKLYARLYGVWASLQSPSDLAKYSYGAYRLISGVNFEDVKGTLTRDISRGGIDPQKDNPTGVKPKEIAFPGFSAVGQVGGYLQQALSPYNLAKKDIQVVDNQCGNGGSLGGKNPDPIVGNGHAANEPGGIYQIGVDIKDKLAEIQEQIAQGLKNIASSVTASRGVTITVGLPKTLVDSNYYLAGEQSFVAGMMPYEITKILKTPAAGGIAPNAIGMKGNKTCGGNVSCSQDAALPLAGGPQLTMNPQAGLLPDMLRPYNPNKQANAGKLLRQLAGVVSTETALINPWQELASFQNPQIEKLTQK